ncbi:MAG: sirohydrochlorin cobaltochelatase [Ruminococcus sp.]
MNIDAHTRKVTDAIEETIGAAFPQYRIYRAWTSKSILAKIENWDHIHYDNVKEAMERMAQTNRRGDRSANLT